MKADLSKKKMCSLAIKTELLRVLPTSGSLNVLGAVSTACSRHLHSPSAAGVDGGVRFRPAQPQSERSDLPELTRVSDHVIQVVILMTTLCRYNC